MNKPGLYLPKEHHSAFDWDMATALWALDPLLYVSPPSCIRYWETIGMNSIQLCKHAGTIKLPEGRIITQNQASHTSNYLYLTFRNTAPPGSVDLDNCYYLSLRFNLTTMRLYERVAGVNSRYWDNPRPALQKDTWYKMRLSWWLEWGILQVRLERWDTDHWLQDGIDITVADPLYGEEDNQRCGIGSDCYSPSYPHFFDDTEIWEYVE
ncbi:hypothetical protein ES703_77853 [subsurface metagenome]